MNTLPPIVILGPGRCGSTLVQRALNTSPDVTIWGEHAGFLRTLAESHWTLTHDPLIKENLYRNPIDPNILIGPLTDFSSSPNWVNDFDPDYVNTCYRDMLIRLLTRNIDPAKTHWGFKEILYARNDRAMQMWRTLFPNTRLIFSIRHPFKVIRSMLLAWEPNASESLNSDRILPEAERFANRWLGVCRSIKRWQEEDGWQGLTVRYEDLVKDPSNELKRMFDYLDIPLPDNVMGPFNIRTEHSTQAPYAADLNDILKVLGPHLWEMVGETAQFYGYENKW